MASLEELRRERLKKLENLRAAGEEVYPIKTGRHQKVASVLKLFAGRRVKNSRSVAVAGRLLGLRRQGGVVFFDLADDSGSIQGVLKRDGSGAKRFQLFAENLDRGDFLWVKGRPYLTERGAKSLEIIDWQILSKSLRPIPTEWFGLKEVEERFRRRYLDSLMSPVVAERFRLRTRLISELRATLDEADYQEVETPMLQSAAGGASAKPFKTHHTALDCPFFLRISPELYLKQMVIGGLERVYELSRNFRNEGIDATHQPEFTMLEFYAAYSTAEEQMIFVEKLTRRAARRVLGKTTLEYQKQKIDLRPAFARVTYFELLRKYAKLNDPLHLPLEQLRELARGLGANVATSDGREKILDAVYKKVCRPQLIKPTFITDFPKDYLPLAKNKPESPELVDAFQLVIAGLEIVKAFSELNDPLEQMARFNAQEAARASGDDEAQSTDRNFVEALEYGMPPCGGVGLGVDRLAMLFTDAANIREVIFFPTLKPRQT